MTINLYDEYDREKREAATKDYLAAAEFAVIEVEAAGCGYRKATISEINASAECAPWAVELYCWRGGLWAKIAA